VGGCDCERRNQREEERRQLGTPSATSHNFGLITEIDHEDVMPKVRMGERGPVRPKETKGPTGRKKTVAKGKGSNEIRKQYRGTGPGYKLPVLRKVLANEKAPSLKGGKASGKRNRLRKWSSWGDLIAAKRGGERKSYNCQENFEGETKKPKKPTRSKRRALIGECAKKCGMTRIRKKKLP